MKAPNVWQQSYKTHAVLRLFCQSMGQCPVALSAIREYHTKVLELLHMLQCIAVYFQLALVWISGEKKYLCHCGAKFHFRLVARSRKPVARSALKAC